MNADLEETLRELGPGYREMVVRMKRCGDVAAVRMARKERRFAPAAAGWAAAACVVLALGVAATLARRSPRGEATAPGIYTVAYGGPAAASEIVRTQNADGSWENDFITRQNAAALRGVAEASVAYRKALRYLRSRGLAPLTDSELHERAELARNRGRS